MDKKYSELIRQSLKEDAAFNDITTKAAIPAGETIKAELIAKQDGILCGLDVFRDVFYALDDQCRVVAHASDCRKVKSGQAIAEITGPARAILAAERTALNFIQRLSGIATLTNTFVEKIKGTKAKIYDTRKTAPGLRFLEKYAVRCGGGYNQRMNLEEMAMFKDNHLKITKDLGKAVQHIRKTRPEVKIEIECETVEQVKKAMELKADIIMLDNMPLSRLRQAATLIHKGNGPQIEVSGGVNIINVRQFAKLGVDRISVGAVTHSAPTLDLSLEII